MELNEILDDVKNYRLSNFDAAIKITKLVIETGNTSILSDTPPRIKSDIDKMLNSYREYGVVEAISGGGFTHDYTNLYRDLDKILGSEKLE